MMSEQQKQTICWDCRKATGGKGCNWADKFEPVNGWKAIKTTIKTSVNLFNKRIIDSYIVQKCPLFEKG